MLQLVAFVPYILFLLVYVFIAWAIVWQVNRYLLPNDASRWVLWIFIAGSVVLIAISLVLFFLIPWEEINL